MVKKAVRTKRPRASGSRSRKTTPEREASTVATDARVAPERALSTRSLTVKAGVEPRVQTVLYIHGIGNKPPASILKCQWDEALFGVQMGDRSRMAYWVNREYYPEPSDESCATGDLVSSDVNAAEPNAIAKLGLRGMVNGDAVDSIDVVNEQIATLTKNPKQRAVLTALSERMLRQGERRPTTGPSAQDLRAKILPLPGFLRKLITRFLTQTLLRDVNDFLFHPDRRAAMEQSLIDRINAGGGPFVVVAHSQGTMIAYNVLRRLTREQADIRLFVTIGSPLGIAEVQDVLKEWGPLSVPPCVRRWVNVADTLDPVAADSDISNDFSGGEIENHAAFGLNPDSPRHPHSGTGYLRTKFVQDRKSVV